MVLRCFCWQCCLHTSLATNISSVHAALNSLELPNAQQVRLLLDLFRACPDHRKMPAFIKNRHAPKQTGLWQMILNPQRMALHRGLTQCTIIIIWVA